MAWDEHLADRVRSILATRRDVSERKLMGALAFMVGDSMCCSVSGDGLLVRIRPEERADALKRPHVTPMTLGRRTMKGFVRVAPEGFRTPTALTKWIERGIAAATVRT